MIPSQGLCIIIIFSGWTVNLISCGRGSDDCLKCICSAVSSCDVTDDCSSDDECGPFKLKNEVWKGAGKLLATESETDESADFKNCAKDLDCSKRTLRAYFDQNAKDCTGDGSIECEDLARIYLVGPDKCSKPSEIVDQDSYKTFVNCTGHPWLRVDHNP